MKLKVITDGTAQGTRVLDADELEEVDESVVRVLDVRVTEGGIEIEIGLDFSGIDLDSE